VDLLPHLLGENMSPPHECLFWRTGGGHSYAVRCGPYKLAKAGNAPAALFDLQCDVAEANDLSAAEPQRVEELSKQYAAWNAQLVPPLWDNPRAAKPPKKAQAQRP